ncbi:MAG: hypothetical protein ACREGB_04985 [Candidatus Saccharimonadales bacterium]
MYRLGEREHRHRKLYFWLSVFTLIVIGCYFGARHFLKSNTETSGSPVKVTNVAFSQPKTQKVDTPLFTMDIPAGWKPRVDRYDIPLPAYSWQGSSGEDRSRWLSVYIDASVADFAVNRALHVEANGPLMNIISAVSDNCTSYTGAANTQTSRTPAKWENIDFICDSGNYERDVVGTVSSAGMNNVTITGVVKGAHHYFFTYTDDSSQSDYTIFTSALKTFTAK